MSSSPIPVLSQNTVTVTMGDPIVVEVRPTGTQGIPGEGVPPGGATGQILAKASNTDYDTEWVTGGGGAVDSVNGQTGVVVLGAADVGAYPDTNPDGFVDADGAASAAPIQSVTGDGVGGTAADVVLTFPTPAEIGAYPDNNPSGFVDAAGASTAAPVQSVNGDTGTVVLDASDVGAEVAWTVTTANSGTLTGVNVIWLADTSAARDRTLDVNGVRLQVKDTTGSAGTNNITLTAGSGQTINGNATEIVDVNYGWVEYVRSGTNWVTIGGQA
jgi:hypothetical protein